VEASGRETAGRIQLPMRVLKSTCCRRNTMILGTLVGCTKGMDETMDPCKSADPFTVLK